ncbi:glycerol kinase [Acetanaerobacterium elongatum]|uniref:Glycerol kinase n=2 Tax=Acetanaerobacterium elongatum TaxID=258515 RepID=A0A1H0H1G5_9FIRM|nr:glycerol kinase [Acetanaerobacterium elongatum]
MSRTTGKAELVKAAEQAIAFQIDAVIKTLTKASGLKLTDLRADGGATRDNYLMQFQCDLLNVPLLASATEELSGAGAGFVAGQSLGLFNAAEAASKLRKNRYTPMMDALKREELLRGWEQAVHAVQA